MTAVFRLPVVAASMLIFTMLLANAPVLAQTDKPQAAPIPIAFLPDVHFHDIYADFSADHFNGLANSKSGKRVAIRTMAAQLHSTRLFNENYFAFLAALDDIATRGVKLVVLPGDFSDDGQPVHVKGLRQVLERYTQQYGIRFLLTLGNHDPVHPYSQPAGKSDYLGTNGTPQPIFSPGTTECDDISVKVHAAGQVICSEQVQQAGYQPLMTELAAFGFYPQADDHYWETPFSHYQQGDYQLATATTQADLSQRQFELCKQGAGGQFRQPDYTDCRQVPDASYLVEPVAGLWLLALDANVYVPDGSQANPNAFKGSGNAGYNALLQYKPHLIAWAVDVAKRAQQQGKTLITFSHFPMLEFYQGQSDNIAMLLGPNSSQLSRRPADKVGETFARSGIRLHVGGHMHLNNTNKASYAEGRFLLNIQSPSIAAYLPAYKLLTVLPGNEIDVNTIALDQVPRFNELFEHYEQEYQQLKQTAAPTLWNHDILTSTSYHQFANWHIRELTRQRFLPSDWPQPLRNLLLSLNGKQMAVLTQLTSQLTLSQLQPSPDQLKQLMQSQRWQISLNIMRQKAQAAGLVLDDFAAWSGFDVALDFYRLRNAGSLALADIDAARLQQYRFLADVLPRRPLLATAVDSQQDVTDYVNTQFGRLFEILKVFSNSISYDHFRINMQTGELTPIAAADAITIPKLKAGV